MKNPFLDTPLFDKLKTFAEDKPVRFHVPGHKGGHDFLDQAAAYYASLLPLDVTELTGLDDLHDPQGVIAEAQGLAASCFHAERTYFLVNGSTVGNLAMLMGTLQQGDQVFVQRNSHKSVFHALAMTQAEAIFLEPQMCPTFSVPVGVTVQQLKEGLKQFPQAKALLLTYPNYYGMAFPMEELIQTAHEHGLIVLVDEAHGAHFGQQASLPLSAMQLGADVCVHSTHKMLSSMTQTSMLHIQGNRVVKEDVEYFLHSLQSSSPSYPLMASLDIARAQLQSMRAEKWRSSLQAYASLRSEIALLHTIRISAAGKVKDHPLGIVQDPFKLIIQPRSDVMSGYQLQRVLEEENIFTELADGYNVLCTLPLIVDESWNERLLRALKKITKKEQDLGQAHKYKPTRSDHINFRYLMDLDKRKLISVPMSVIRSEQKEEVPLERAVDLRAAEMITPYPPGIPLLLPGEVISKEIVEHMDLLQKNGAYFQGKGRTPLEQIQVLKNHSSREDF